MQPSARGGRRTWAPAWLSAGGSGSRSWLLYGVFAVAVGAAYFALPTYGVALGAALGVSSVVACVAGVIRHRPAQRAAWYLVAGAAVILIAGDTAHDVLTQVLLQANPFPSVADVCYLLTYPVLATAVVMFTRGRSLRWNWASLIDVLIFATGAGLLAWVYVLAPTFQAPGVTGQARLFLVAYSLGDVLALALLTRLVVDGGLRIPAMRLLALGVIGLVIAGVPYVLGQVHGYWQRGGLVDVGLVTFYAAWGCAALHPSMVQIGGVLRPRGTSIRRLRATLLGSAMLVSPVLFVVESVGGGVVHAGAEVFFSAVLSVLVIVRLRGIADVHVQHSRREQILRACSGDLVAAQGLPDVYQVALDGASTLTRATHAAIYVVNGESVGCAAGSGALHDEASVSDLWRAAVSEGNLSVTGTISVAQLWSGRTDRGLLVVESATRFTHDEHAALAALTALVALAVRSVSLADAVVQRRSERRFEGLLQNTPDVIVVVDALGRITHASASLGRALGLATEDLLGHALTGLLEPDDADQAAPIFAGFAARTLATHVATDWSLRHRNGTSAMFEVLFNNLLADDAVAGIVLTMRDISARRAFEAKVGHQAFRDPLTGLANRALFQDRAEHALARAERPGTAVAVMMVDLDDFTNVNDTQGHAAGDEVLAQVAARLASTIRVGDTVSRFGGDEFAILVEDLSEVADAVTIADRVLAAFTSPFVVSGQELRVGASIGVVASGRTRESRAMVTDLMQCADLALCVAKESGKGQVVHYHQDLRTRILDRFTSRTDLEHALDGADFVVHYQPIVSLETGEIVQCEALVRWEHPSRGLILPAGFVALAEETGLIVDIGLWALDEACAQLRTWVDAGHPGLRMSVPVTSRQLREAGFVDGVRAALTRHDLRPEQLVLELAESSFALDPPEISQRLWALHDVGIRIAMDDFGTGSSTLSLMHKLPLDILTIDKAFVDELGEGDADASTMAGAVVSLARSLHLEVIAEGIERPGQRDRLWSMGCRLGQGFLYAGPVDPDRLTAVLMGPPSLWALPVAGLPGVPHPHPPSLPAVPIPTQPAPRDSAP